MDLASGLVSIAAGAFQLGPIAGPIVGALQAAALVILTRNNIKKIRAERLDAPTGSAGTNSAPAASTIALSPTQTALLSPQENLNAKDRQSTAWVRVSEINTVQKRVGVRESNQRF
jgi:tetrahydromethanopterin S-methyltransferase subunit C